MKTRFFRSRSIEIPWQSPSDEKSRGLFFDLALGLEAPIDPESGMTLNLIHVEKILDSLEFVLKNRVWPSKKEALAALAPVLLRSLEAHPQVTASEISLCREDRLIAIDPRNPTLFREFQSRRESSGPREKIVGHESQNGQTSQSESRPKGPIKVRRTLW